MGAEILIFNSSRTEKTEKELCGNLLVEFLNAATHETKHNFKLKLNSCVNKYKRDVLTS